MQQETLTGTVAIGAQRDIGPCASGFYTSGLGALCLLSRFSCVLRPRFHVTSIDDYCLQGRDPGLRRSSGVSTDGRRLERLLFIETCVGSVVKCCLNWDFWDWGDSWDFVVVD